MAIDITKADGGYILDYTLYGSEYASNWWNEHTERRYYVDYSKREAILRFKQYLHEKFPNYNFEFDRRKRNQEQ